MIDGDDDGTNTDRSQFDVLSMCYRYAIDLSEIRNRKIVENNRFTIFRLNFLHQFEASFLHLALQSLKQ